MLVGDVISATVPWVKENPVIAPHVLRLTSAVACCQVGFLTECIESPSSAAACGSYLPTCLAYVVSVPLAGPRQRLQDRLDLRITWVIGVLVQHADIPGGGGGSADHPVLIDGGDKCRLARRTGHRLGT